MILNILSAFVFADIFGLGQMTTDTMFGLKIVALVMLYGYMHMNLGGGLLSTAVFLIFGYYFLFYAQGTMAIVVLALFFFMVHGFDIIWGGDMVRSGAANMMAQKQAQREMMMMPRMPPP